MIIIDMGSGNTCHNDLSYVKRMIDTLASINTDKNKVIIKWQLFENASPNIPLDWAIFSNAIAYARNLGYETTASVFDKKSLDFLLRLNPPFVKIANRRDLDWLMGDIPRKINIIQSVASSGEFMDFHNGRCLACVSNYPATIEEYEERFDSCDLETGISDHTTDWTLYRKYNPEIYECHFCLEHDEKNPDGGLFSRTPEKLKEIL